MNTLNYQFENYLIFHGILSAFATVVRFPLLSWFMECLLLEQAEQNQILL